MSKIWWSRVRSRLRNAASGGQPSRRQRIRPGIERLEDRCVPTVVLTAQIAPPALAAGTPANFSLGTLFDNDNVPPGSIGVFVQWDDGTANPATLTPGSAANTFNLSSGHVFKLPGQFTVTLTAREGVPAVAVASAATTVIATGPVGQATSTTKLGSSVS